MDGVGFMPLEGTWGVENPPWMEEAQVRACEFLSPTGMFYPRRTGEPLRVSEALADL